MMSINEHNEIIYQMVYNSIIKYTTNILTLTEFGYFKYYVCPGDSNTKEKSVCLAYKNPEFKSIYDFSGKNMIEKEYKEFNPQINVILDSEKWDFSLTASMEKFAPIFAKLPKTATEEEKKKKSQDDAPLQAELEEYAKTTATKLAGFNTRFLVSVWDQMLQNVSDKKECKLFSFHLNEKNMLHVLPNQDRIVLIYGIDFSQSTDIALAKIFLQEWQEAKRHVKNCVDANVYAETSTWPNDIANVDKVSNYSNGLVVFNLYTKNHQKLKEKYGYFINFRQYIQFHIHSIKTFWHIRMNKKGKEIENKLNQCKIIPDEYYKKMKTLNFFVNWEKKEEREGVFNQDVSRLNV